MEIKIKLNGKMVSDDIPADMLLIDFVRAHNCFSVNCRKRLLSLWVTLPTKAPSSVAFATLAL